MTLYPFLAQRRFILELHVELAISSLLKIPVGKVSGGEYGRVGHLADKGRPQRNVQRDEGRWVPSLWYGPRLRRHP